MNHKYRNLVDRCGISIDVKARHSPLHTKFAENLKIKFSANQFIIKDKVMSQPRTKLGA